MRKFTFILAFLIVSVAAAFGQSTADSISLIKSFGTYKFYQGENRLTMKQLTTKLESNEQAFMELKSAKSVFVTTYIFGIAGGYFIANPLGTAIGGGEPNWALAGIGAALIVVTITLNQSFNNKAKQAVDTYNSGLGKSAFWDKTELKLSLTGDGIGLTLRL
ncbi:MAG: hypothetical protein K8F24_11000 [Bacteroidales bacterium]|nr:hypothetical protein [Bacteroidales bacterium]